MSIKFMTFFHVSVRVCVLLGTSETENRMKNAAQKTNWMIPIACTAIIVFLVVALVKMANTPHQQQQSVVEQPSAMPEEIVSEKVAVLPEETVPVEVVPLDMVANVETNRVERITVRIKPQLSMAQATSAVPQEQHR